MTGQPFLTNVGATYRIAVEVAWAADLTDLTAASWTWSDITTDVLIDPADQHGGGGGRAITITVGSPDESPGQQTQASQMTCTLDNRSGAYSLGGQSTLWPNVKRGVPVRVRVSTNSGSSWTVKYQGSAVSWQPGWDEAGRFATVLLTASGPLRQLNQGSLTSTSPLSYNIARGVPASALVGHWPMEDGSAASTAASLVTNTAAFSKDAQSGIGSNPNGTGTPTFAGYTDFVGTASGMTVPASCFLTAAVGSHTVTGSYQASFLIGGCTPNTSGNWNQYVELYFSGKTLVLMSFSTSGVDLNLTNGPGSSGITTYLTLKNGSGVTLNFGANPAFVTITAKQNGANIDLGLYGQTITAAGGAATLWSATTSISGTLGTLTKVGLQAFNPAGSGMTGASFGQMMITNTIDASISAGVYGLSAVGYGGEAVTTRLARLAATLNIPVTVLTDTAVETSTNPLDTVASQPTDTLTNILRECEATGQGLLLDGLNNGLTYVTRQLRESQQPALTLDASAGGLALDFEPIDDDQNTVNQFGVTSRNASSGSYTDVSGPLGANALGVYSSSVTINPDDDTKLPYYAQWMVHLGTATGYRYPTISFALEWQPSKITAWLACIPSSRMDITNIRSLRTQHPDGTIRQVLAGWEETITAHSWHVRANCSPWLWNVGTMAAATGTTVDTVMRRDTDGSAVNTAAAAGATSLSVARTNASYPLWTTAADDFPLTLDVAGMPCTVTAISGAASPQTFTIAAPGLPKAVAVGDPVTLWNPPVLGM